MDVLSSLIEHGSSLVNQGRDRWDSHREERMEKAAKQFIGSLIQHPQEATRHLPRIIKAFRDAPKGVTGTAWILTCQDEIARTRPDLLETYYRGVVEHQNHAHVLAVLLRRRPDGIPLLKDDIDRLLKLTNGIKYGQQELLTLLIDEFPAHKNFYLLEHFLANTRGMKRMDDFTHPVAGFVRGPGKRFDVIDVPLAVRAIELLNRHQILNDYKNQPEEQYLLGKLCQWVDDDKVPEEAIGQVLEQGVSWEGHDKGEGVAATYIRRHPVWRQAHLNQQLPERQKTALDPRKM